MDVADCKTIGALPCACFLVVYIIYSNISITKVVTMMLWNLYTITTLLGLASAQSSCPLSPSGNVKPSVASGYKWQVVATGLARPRGLAFDDRGRLLVIESDSGDLSAHTLTEDGGGCVTVNSSKTVVEGMSVSCAMGKIWQVTNLD